MAELRYHPLIDDWVIIASSRQNRPHMPADWCPFCPGSGRVPDEGYTVLRYPNDFPALSNNPPVPDDVANHFFKTLPAYGRCEVLLYSPEHNQTLSGLSDDHMHAVAKMWKECFVDFRQDEAIKYVFLFENRGNAVGVTMPHPHGQAYGYSVLPKKIQLEAAAAKKHHAATGECLYCTLLREERAAEQRVIFQNEHFAVLLPFFTEYPYGVYVFANRHYGSIDDMTDAELKSLGITVKQVSGMFDSLFGYSFPYMLCMHNAPVNSGDYTNEWHFHIEFFPPMRASDKQKFNASSETGAWAHCNPTCPEEKAQELKEAYARWMKGEQA
ncbi:galactose-1-phosphate uridylyltransferase [Christensenellaceae bacterium OttesenSCG-928-L17]|nr:galactose-1-phosphate uridylyltransferase [Christensenellaceae bacterium OttesenSCG-928-L17]